jgi:hypothetical protein
MSEDRTNKDPLLGGLDGMRAGQHWAGEPDSLKHTEGQQASAESDTAAADPAEKAEKNGLTVSTLIRKTVLGKQINARIDEDFLKELMRLGRLQKHLFVEGKRTGDKEYAEVLVAITELANTLRRNLMGR